MPLRPACRPFPGMLKKITCLLVLLLTFCRLMAQPVIQSFSPASAMTGQTVTVTGLHFGATPAANTVYFGATKAEVVTASQNQLTVKVPHGATYHPITVTVGGLTAYSTHPFHAQFAGSGSQIAGNSFTSALSVLPGVNTNPRKVIIADFNRDGKPDLFVTNQTSGMGTYYKNQSTPQQVSLSAKKEIMIGNDAFWADAGDFDGDGWTDLAVANFNQGNAGNLVILKNTSADTLSFEKIATYPAGNGPTTIVVTDIDLDGKPDVAVAAGNSGFVYVFKNTTSGGVISFAPPLSFQAFNHPEIALGDLDGDNKPELILSNFGGPMNIWKNLSSGGTISFAPVATLPTGVNSTQPVLGDLDGDGKLDIAVSTYSSNTVVVLRNTTANGTISFEVEPPLSTNTLPRNLTMDDMNGDGKIDIISTADNPATVSIYQNKSVIDTIRFNQHVDYQTGAGPPSVTTGDLDGDGKPEMLVPNQYEKVTVFRNVIDYPSMFSFNPSVGATNDTITISGANLAEASAVSFGDVPAKSFTIEGNIIRAVVDTGAGGLVKVTTPYGFASLNGFTYLPPLPVITSFTPSSGGTGTIVTIKGILFTGATKVIFGNTAAASFNVSSDSIITAVVGSGATGGVAVTTPKGSDTLGVFTFIAPAPVVNQVLPSAGTEGTSVNISGKYLTSVTQVSFGGTAASSFTIINDTLLTAIVGAGSTGVVRVASPYGADTSTRFTFYPPEELVAYPNPAEGSAMFVHPSTEKISSLQLIDIMGKVTKTVQVIKSSSYTRVDLSGIKPGVYKMVWNDGVRTVNRTIVVR